MPPSSAEVASARWIGDVTRRELSSILAFLQTQLPIQRVSLPDVLQSHPASEDIQLMVVATLWKGEYSSGELDALCRRFPRATIVQILSAWCESGRRHGDAKGRLHAVPWHSFDAWWSRYGPATAAAPSESMKVTGPGESRQRAAGEGQLGIVTAHRELADLYLSICQSHQIAADWLQLPSLKSWQRPETYSAFLWDEAACNRAVPPDLSSLIRVARGRLVLAIRSAVHVEHPPAEQLVPYAEHVVNVAKPVDVDDLVALIRRHAERCRQSLGSWARSA